MIYKEYDNTKIQTLEYETTINSDGNILGVCELGKATIQLLNEDNEYSSFKGSWIKTIHGSFYVYDVTPIQEKINIRLDCYDIKYKLDSKYDSSKHTFPCTLKEWRNSIFDVCNVEYDNSDFPNSDLVLSNQPYIGENTSNRAVIAIIAQAGVSIVITDSNDKFYFSWFKDTTHIIDDWLELTTEKEKSNPINCVVLGRGEVEDNVYYPTTKPSNPVEFRIDNNYILDPQDTSSSTDLRYQTIIPIYNRVNNFSYLIFNMRTQKVDNKLSIKLGEKIKYNDIWGNELAAYVMTKKIKYLGGDLGEDDNYEIILSSSEIKESSTELSYASSIANELLEVSRKTNKNTGEIQDLSRKIIDVSNTKTATGSITLENAHEGPLHKLSIKGQMDFRTDSSLVTGDDLSDKLLKFSWPSEGTTVEHHITTDQEYEIIMSDNYQIRGGLNQALIISESYSLHDNNLTYIDTLYNESGLEVITSKNQYKLPNDFGVITFIDDGAEVLPYIKTPKFITKPKLLIDNIEYEIDLDYLNYISDTICDEFIYMDGKCSIIRRVGIDTNGNKYALESEIIEEREDIILEVKTNSTIYLQTVNDATYEVSYLLENEYTKTFANQLETKAEIEMMSNEIEAKVSAVTDENGEITSASIKLALNNDTSGIKLKSDMLDLDANKIINIIAGNEINLSSKSISINSDNFKVTTAGVLTASNVNITGGSIKLTATSLANIVQVGRDGGLRTVMQGNGLLGYNSNGNRMFYLSSMGGLVIDDGQITTPRISAGNIASGYDYANSSTDTTIYFGKTFPSTPAVVATAWTYTTGVIALKVRNITTTSFDIVVGGNVSGSIGFTWIAIG